mgnify:CR=1 FL=1
MLTCRLLYSWHVRRAMRVKALAMAMALLIGLGGVPESFAQKKIGRAHV